MLHRQNQSPVNITETVSGKLPAIKVNYKPSMVDVENNGHTIQVNYPEGGNTLTVNGRTYTLKQFHFHVPSENQIKVPHFPDGSSLRPLRRKQTAFSISRAV